MLRRQRQLLEWSFTQSFLTWIWMLLMVCILVFTALSWRRRDCPTRSECPRQRLPRGWGYGRETLLANPHTSCLRRLRTLSAVVIISTTDFWWGDNLRSPLRISALPYWVNVSAFSVQRTSLGYTVSRTLRKSFCRWLISSDQHHGADLFIGVA